jgi:hypothetical protein
MPASSAELVCVADMLGPVLPIRGKQPLTPHGYKDATRDPGEIERLFEREHVGSNVGVATGDGLLVVDVDGADGEASLSDVEQRYGELPATVCSRTGRGRHLFFRYSPGREVRSSGGKLGAGIDVKAGGGYVVVPPSEHASGAHYTWVVPPWEPEIGIAEAPAWLLDVLTGVSESDSSETSRSRLSHLLDHRPEEGNRNNWLTQVAGHFAKSTPYRDAYESLVRQQAAGLDLEPEEVDRVIESIWNAERAKETGVPGLLLTPIADFARVDERGADALVGTAEEVLIPEAGDVMFYGDGGAGKTTLTIDLAMHLATATDWLGFEISRAVSTLIIEGEGPRPLLRRKLRRKLDGWSGALPGDRFTVWEKPWAQFTFATEEWRAALASQIVAKKIDVIIAGPLTRIGMDSAGTLQEVVAFLKFINDLRALCGRPLTVILVHHENKGGTVSGAWEGAGDTLFHVEANGNGKTTLTIEKARWSSEAHGTTHDLVWTEGESFCVNEDADPIAEIMVALTTGPLTIDNIAAAIKSRRTLVKDALQKHGEHFVIYTGDEARQFTNPETGKPRSARAILYGLKEGSDELF